MKKCKNKQCLTEISENAPDFCPEHNSQNITNYERNGSHTHCWNQGKSPACGQPLEKHKQCCLCDTPAPITTIEGVMNKKEKVCLCPKKYCEHYESDFDRFVKNNPMPKSNKNERCCTMCDGSGTNFVCNNDYCQCHYESPTPIEEILREYDEYLSELNDPDHEWSLEGETEVNFFGHKSITEVDSKGVKTIYTVTDWGNIRTFIQKSLLHYGERIGREIVICSAIKCYDDTIIRCHRHNDGIALAHKMGKYTIDATQGFITSRNRYVSREEGRKLQDAAGIKSVDKDGYLGNTLFSEDLY